MHAPIREDSARGVADSPARVMWVLALSILVGVVLRGVEASAKSLWLDEYHTLWLADSSGFGEVAQKVRPDFWPPVFFWVLSAFRGVDPHVQRWVPILLSLLTLWPLWSIARAGGLTPLARVVVCGVFLCVPYQVQYAAELRSYSGVQLMSVLLVWAAVTSRSPPWVRLVVFGGATALGLYLHYGLAVAVVSVGFARLFLRPAGAVPLLALIAAGVVGVLAFMPWMLTVEGWMFTDPGQILPPDARGAVAAVGGPPWWDHELDKAAVVLPRTLVPMMGALGGWVGEAMQVVAGLLFAVLAAGIVCVARQVRRQPRRAGNKAVWTALLASLAGYALMTFLCVVFWQRVPMQYFVVASWGWPLLAGLTVHCCATTRGAHRLAAGLLLASLGTGLLHDLGASREATEDGVRSALAVARENSIYTAVLWQPPWYPHTTPFRYGDVPAGLDVREPRDVPGGDEEPRPVVVVTRRSVPGGEGQPGVWDSIRRQRSLDRVVHIDEVTRVYVYVPR